MFIRSGRRRRPPNPRMIVEVLEVLQGAGFFSWPRSWHCPAGAVKRLAYCVLDLSQEQWRHTCLRVRLRPEPAIDSKGGIGLGTMPEPGLGHGDQRLDLGKPAGIVFGGRGPPEHLGMPVRRSRREPGRMPSTQPYTPHQFSTAMSPRIRRGTRGRACARLRSADEQGRRKWGSCHSCRPHDNLKDRPPRLKTDPYGLVCNTSFPKESAKAMGGNTVSAKIRWRSPLYEHVSNPAVTAMIGIIKFIGTIVATR
jgi:hypothetical protein